MDIYIVDRIEENFAVCEKNGETIVDLKLSDLPESVHEGSVLKQLKNGIFFEDKEEEERLREEANALTDDLFDE